MTMKKRCEWANGHPLLMTYHDEDWGVPERNDTSLFQLLTLEGAQAGLNWLVVLKKRPEYQTAFDDFVPGIVAKYGVKKVEELLANPGIIRNRLKILSAIRNARALLEIKKEFGSFNSYIWQFVSGEPIVNSWTVHEEIPSSTPESDAMSKDLKKRGFNFVGSTICYAFMQSAGLVNDHMTDCFRYNEVSL